MIGDLPKQSKQGLNKSGLIIIDEKEDLIDGIKDSVAFFKHGVQKQFSKEKNNTANVVDLIKSLNKKET
jgi:hypothetical protein